MTPEELAKNFVHQFDKLNTNDKSECLNEIARIFKHNYHVPLWFRIVEDIDADNYEFIDLDFLISKTDITFLWDC